MNSVTPGLPDIAKLQSLMKAGIESGAVFDAVPQTRLEHSFIPGGYARQLWRPKGTLIVGKIHRHECFNFLMSGKLRVYSEGITRDFIAPCFWKSGAGTRKVTFAMEDSLLITVHPTELTDLDELEAELTIPDPPEAALEKPEISE